MHYYSDLGYGTCRLYFLRDKEQREVDFLAVKDEKPWFLVETKLSAEKPVSKNLSYYQEMLQVPHAFQVTRDLPYVNRDCFEENQPVKVPAATFLSQLI